MKNFCDFISDLQSLISINSEKATPTPNAPFGEGNKKALSLFCEIATRLGFEVTNHQNYIAEFSVGEGQEIGIIGHLDVVPAGDNWNTPPFTLTEKDGVYFARGVSDDKGPTLLALYALKEVVDSGITFNKKIKFFVGSNEETGWGDIDYYLNNVGNFPEYGFSPDGEFPLSYAEKGICQTKIFLPPFKQFDFIQGGTALNQVCDFATVKPRFLPNEIQLKEFGLDFDGEKITSRGVAAHGSTPHVGKNAIKPILEFMLSCGEDVKALLECVFNQDKPFCGLQNEQGWLTVSPNLAYQENGCQVIECDFRVPYPFTKEEVTSGLEKFNLNYKNHQRHVPMCVDKDGWFVKALLGAYNSVTGENAKPISMGGSTYARAFKLGCAFGAGFPNTDNGAHKPNEFVTKKEMLTAFEIYKQAIENLVK